MSNVASGSKFFPLPSNILHIMTEQQNQKQQAIDLLESRYRGMETDTCEFF